MAAWRCEPRGDGSSDLDAIEEGRAELPGPPEPALSGPALALPSPARGADAVTWLVCGWRGDGGSIHGICLQAEYWVTFVTGSAQSFI